MTQQKLLFRLQRFWEKSSREKLEAIRSHFKTAWDRIVRGVLPIPVRLPYGGLWLCYDDWLDNMIFVYRDFSCRKILERLLCPNMVVFDVGAHHGFYTLLASKRVGPKGLVVAFEPSPRELKRLRQHITLNHCFNVWIEPMAVGDYNGMANFFVIWGKGDLNSLQKPRVQEQETIVTIQVPIVTLDRYVSDKGISRVDFIKIDTEGADLKVLKGASKLLQRSPRPIVMCEFIDNLTERFGYKASEIYDFLQERGYSWFEPTSEGLLRPTHKKAEYRDISARDYIAVPEERLADILALIKGE